MKLRALRAHGAVIRVATDGGSEGQSFLNRVGAWSVVADDVIVALRFLNSVSLALTAILAQCKKDGTLLSLPKCILQVITLRKLFWLD